MFNTIHELLNNQAEEFANSSATTLDSTTSLKYEENQRLQELIEIINQFIEKSNYGEFSIRMNIIKGFEQYLHYMNDYDSNINMKHFRKTLISILYNIHLYFNQFTNEINEYIITLRQPIEKKLKEFVKIESYNKDLSYFSMKNNIARVHRNLHKFLKEYENGLLQRISNIFQFKESQTIDINLKNDKGINLRYQSKDHYYIINFKYYLALSNYSNKYSLNNVFIEDNGNNIDANSATPTTLLLRIDKLFLTSRNICKEIILHSKFQNLIYNVDELLTDNIDRLEYLRKLEIDRNQERPKQKLQAKNILQQKRKGLSDFYKTLTNLGVNYRTGLMEHVIRKQLINFKIKPFSIPLMCTQTNHKHIDQNLIYLNENLDLYYTKCVFRLKLLETILLTPNNELGLRNVERIKGFSVDMFLMVQKQRHILGKSITEIAELKQQIASILNLNDCLSITVSTKEDCNYLNFEFLTKKYLQLRDSYCKVRNFFIFIFFVKVFLHLIYIIKLFNSIVEYSLQTGSGIINR